MADEAKIGRPWNDDDLDAIVADYFSMLRAELSRQPYVKSHHSVVLMKQIGRTHRPVEFKHQYQPFWKKWDCLGSSATNRKEIIRHRFLVQLTAIFRRTKMQSIISLLRRYSQLPRMRVRLWRLRN